MINKIWFRSFVVQSTPNIEFWIFFFKINSFYQIYLFHIQSTSKTYLYNSFTTEKIHKKIYSCTLNDFVHIYIHFFSFRQWWSDNCANISASEWTNSKLNALYCRVHCMNHFFEIDWNVFSKNIFLVGSLSPFQFFLSTGIKKKYMRWSWKV